MSPLVYTPQPQSIAALWPVHIFRLPEGRRLSWPGRLGEILRWFDRPKSPLPVLDAAAGIELATAESQVQLPNH